MSVQWSILISSGITNILSAGVSSPDTAWRSTCKHKQYLFCRRQQYSYVTPDWRCASSSPHESHDSLELNKGMFSNFTAYDITVPGYIAQERHLVVQLDVLDWREGGVSVLGGDEVLEQVVKLNRQVRPNLWQSSTVLMHGQRYLIYFLIHVHVHYM